MKYTYEYPRMLVTVDALVLLKHIDKPYDILLIKRGHEPYKNKYALPGGFPEMNELLVDAAARELYEETGLRNIELKQLATFDNVNRDPRGRNISVVYYGFTPLKNSAIKAGDDASEAKWVPINNLPELAFDHRCVVDCLINRIGKTEIIF